MRQKIRQNIRPDQFRNPSDLPPPPEYNKPPPPAVRLPPPDTQAPPPPLPPYQRPPPPKMERLDKLENGGSNLTASKGISGSVSWLEWTQQLQVNTIVSFSIACLFSPPFSFFLLYVIVLYFPSLHTSFIVLFFRPSLPPSFHIFFLPSHLPTFHFPSFSSILLFFPFSFILPSSLCTFPPSHTYHLGSFFADHMWIWKLKTCKCIA